MAINPYDPYAQEILGLEQQKATAQKLREQAMTPAQGQMVSGWYVAPNITQHLAKALQGYTGMVGEEKAQQGIKDIIGKAQKEQEDWLKGMPTSRTETSMSPYMAETPAGGRDYADITSSQAYQQATVQPSVEDLLGWSMKAPGASPTERATMAMTIAKLREDRQTKKEEADINRAWRSHEAELNRQGRLDIANLAAGNKMVNILGPNGEAIMMPANEVGPGMQRWTPQGAQALQKEQKTGTAKGEVADIVGTLRTSYNRLNDMNAIPSTQNRWGTNLGAKLATTGPGQWLGGAFGTQAQSEREKISQTRPLLLNAIKNATGMSAQQMNSNAELQLYLRAATDPSLTYEANMEALDTLDRLYGLGLNRGNAPAPTTQAAPSISAPPPGAVREKR